MCAKRRSIQRGRPRQPAPSTLPDDLYDYDDDPAPRISPPRGSPPHVFDAPRVGAWIETRPPPPWSRPYDDSPRLQYLNARYYDPALSLFTSPDWLEITEPGVGTNRYAYVGNSPLNQSDPGGNCFVCVGAVVGAVVGLCCQVGIDIYKGHWSSADTYAKQICSNRCNLRTSDSVIYICRGCIFWGSGW